MALNRLMLLELCKRMEPGATVASFGYPDILVPLPELEPYLQGLDVTFRVDSPAICRRHGLAPRPIPDADSLFDALGAKLHVFDIVKERGNEIICDLNEPMRTAPYYDFVLDIGTIEHCFNIGLAVKNMASLVKVGGIIMHENPFFMPNHGFYSLNPTFYTDFYEANGFKVLECLLLHGKEQAKPPQTARFKTEARDATNVFFMAERMEVRPFVWPTQTKYKQIYAAAGLSQPGEKEKAHEHVG